VTTINVIFFWRELAQFMFLKRRNLTTTKQTNTYILGLNLLRYHCQRISFTALKSAKFNFLREINPNKHPQNEDIEVVLL